MAKSCLSFRAKGFSMVELLVALVFTTILMAGLASVFKASLSTFYTSGEILSSARRNRMSIDLLGDDLNTAAMYLTDLSVPPPVVPTNPPFYIIPNVLIPGAGTSDPQRTDELYFYLDQPVPFEANLDGAAPQQTAAELVVAEKAAVAADKTFTIECHTDAYVKQIKVGQVFIFKDSWETAYVESVGTPSGTKVNVTAGADPLAQMTGTGSAGLPSKAKHLPNSGVVFIQPAQMVRYHVEMLQLDPQNATGIPCLVRDQGIYIGTGFVPQQPQQIITENVSGFKVYVSANSGVSWAGLGMDTSVTGFSDGWDLGIRTDLDTQLQNSGRLNYQTTRGSEHWFRSIPTLVRVDVTTRTATQRAEYSTTPGTAAYRDFTQSLVFVPRHSGLTMN